MAYTKTNWVNGEAPALNATNLNKIEQGIADAQNTMVTIDAGGNGDYLTITDAFNDGQYKMFLRDGTHVVSGEMNVDAGTEIVLRGESKEGTVIDFSGAGNEMFQANDDIAGDYNKWSATGTYTKSGNDLTFTGHENNDLTTVYAVGDKVVLGTHAGVGVAVITRLSTNVMELDTFTMTGLQDQHFGEADWIWTIGSCGLTVENLTLDTGLSNKTFIRQSLDDLVLWDYVLDGVRIIGRAYSAYDFDTCWRSVYNDTGGWEYLYFACRSIISNCDLKQVYIDGTTSKIYGGDTRFIACTIQQDEGGNYLSPNTIFDSCLFLYDLTTQASHGEAISDSAKFVNCIDINGLYTQPVTSISLGAITWTTGSGTPEGVITAPVGSLFTRTDGGANTTLYVKESGTGNTGWIAK